jgi:hypothetical protein
MRLLRVSPLVLVLASLICSSNFAQQEPRPPKIVFEAKSATNTLGTAFGQSCKATPNASSPYYRSSPSQPVSIADLLRAPVAEVKILRYGAGWKNQDDIRERLLDVLGARTLEIFDYEPWDEAAFTDILATIHFADKTQAALEVSGVHVCFTDHSGAVIWTRIGTRVIEKRNGKTK